MPRRSDTRLSLRRRTNRKTTSTVAAGYTTARLASPNVTSPRRFRSSACAISALTLTRGLSLESVFESTNSRRKRQEAGADGRKQQKTFLAEKMACKHQRPTSRTCCLLPSAPASCLSPFVCEREDG